MDESFGYCQYCFDDDFYAWSACGSRDAGGLRLSYTDDELKPMCSCREGEVLRKGKCTTCGNNCHNCTDTYCISCDYGYWLDHTGTVCINFCPTGSVYDDARESGMCVSTHGFYDIVDYTFTCAEMSDMSDPMIQRRWDSGAVARPWDGHEPMWITVLYGGANEYAIEFDDPRPVDNRGYWFNGECQFMTLRGFNPSLSPNIGGWMKFHHSLQTILSIIPILADPLIGHQYNVLNYDAGQWSWGNAKSRRFSEVSGSVELYEWHYHSFSLDNYKGEATFTVGLDGDSLGQSTTNSFLHLYHESEVLLGAFNGHLEDGLKHLFKGFMYTLTMGIYHTEDFEKF